MDYFHLNVDREQLLSMSSLGLAHLGDGVFEVMVRSWIALHGKAKPKDLHRATVTYVSAPAQAAAMEKLLPQLSEEEADVYRRGRNTAPHSVPGPSTRRLPGWRPCLAGCTSRAAPSGSTSCLRLSCPATKKGRRRNAVRRPVPVRPGP